MRRTIIIVVSVLLLIVVSGAGYYIRKHKLNNNNKTTIHQEQQQINDDTANTTITQENMEDAENNDSNEEVESHGGEAVDTEFDKETYDELGRLYDSAVDSSFEEITKEADILISESFIEYSEKVSKSSIQVEQAGVFLSDVEEVYVYYALKYYNEASSTNELFTIKNIEKVSNSVKQVSVEGEKRNLEIYFNEKTDEIVISYVDK